MQTPKARQRSLEVPRKRSQPAVSSSESQKISPRSLSHGVKTSPRAVPQLKTAVPECKSPSQSYAISKLKDRSSKITEQRSPQSFGSEVTKLESRISEPQTDLKKVKDQLSSTEAVKIQAEQDIELLKMQFAVMSSILEGSEKQLLKQTAASEETYASELQSSFKQESQTLQSELGVTDSTALLSSLCGIKQSKSQLGLNSSKENLKGSFLLAEDMETQLRDNGESVAQAQPRVNETLLQLEAAKKTVETLRSDGLKAMNVYGPVTSELDKSRAPVNLLEEIACKLPGTIFDCRSPQSMCDQNEIGQNEENRKMLEAEISSMKSEIEHLRAALEAVEIRYNEEQTRSTLEIRGVYELMEQMKSISGNRETVLKEEVDNLKVEIEGLKANLMDKETELQGICDENETLRLENMQSGQRKYALEQELQNSKVDIENLKANLMHKETELQKISEENKMLMLEVRAREPSKGNVNHEVDAELERAKAAGQEALMKLGYMKEEVEKSNRQAARVAEQLDVSQAMNAELEAELRRLKIHSDQWRKAAEAAAAILSAGNGRFMDRTVSMDSQHWHRSGKLSPPFSEGIDEDFLKRKNANMLKRIGILWKKAPK
ncbi:interactor of constitutive active ROPs 3-like [Ipomoea triloba]|uniref:interactor of constitutive active ROPs 3-like n=1 Tax=Ipomoea triloba TaxID=35885 RepID=UPI00125DD9C6|nr:interactor of constitutive active ROPs 3-like [Ipomoea triloba]XP_031111279.1 interactor of constitutive active ROPs 3-like [Ipomoea triloba]